MKKVTIVNGPNLNLLGQREPEIYGYDTLQSIEEKCQVIASTLDLEVTFLQSNHEGQIVEWIQQAVKNSDALVINAGAYTHTSVAIHDALKVYSGYKIELHISNPYQREAFRHHSYLSPVVDAVMAGLGANGYGLAVKAIADRFSAL